jgi:hypothetical protein
VATSCVNLTAVLLQRHAAIRHYLIKRVWITSHFGVLSKRPARSDEGFLFINGHGYSSLLRL